MYNKDLWRSDNRAFFEAGRGFRGLDVNLALRRLDMLNVAMALDSISPFRSVKLHRLLGQL